MNNNQKKGKTNMYKNNFDKSSTGINMEIYCYYDTCLSQEAWSKNFVFSLSHETRYNSNDVFYFIDRGNLENRLETIDFDIKGKVLDMKKFLKNEFGCFENSEINKMRKETLIDEILEFFSRRYCRTISGMQKFNDQYFESYNIELITVPELAKIEIRGYGQGEYAEIYYCPSDCLKTWGSIPDEEELREVFHNFFYDSVISCKAIINGQEYDYYEMPGFISEYEWNRDAWIEYIKKETGYDISDFVPSYPVCD